MSAVTRYHPNNTDFVCSNCQRPYVWAGRTYIVCRCGAIHWKFSAVEDWEDAVVGYHMNDGQRERWREHQAELEQRLRNDRSRQEAELATLQGGAHVRA